MKEVKKYKVFPWWLILLLVIVLLQTVNNIGRYGIENCHINWFLAVPTILILCYRIGNKSADESESSDDEFKE